MLCLEEMERDLLEEALVREEASDAVEVVAGWEVAVSAWVENASVPVAVTRLLIREVLPAMRFGVQNADHR